MFASWELGTGHQEVKETSRVPKAYLVNTVAQFEALMPDPEIPKRDRQKLERLVDTWNKKRESLANVPDVPGVREVPTKKEPSEEEHEAARLMIQLLKLVLEKEMTAEDKVASKYSVKATRISNRHRQQHQ